MAVEIECVTEVSDELAEAFARLMPQLSPRLGALSRQAMERVVCSDGAALFAARLDGRIARGADAGVVRRTLGPEGMGRGCGGRCRSRGCGAARHS